VDYCLACYQLSRYDTEQMVLFHSIWAVPFETGQLRDQKWGEQRVSGDLRRDRRESKKFYA